MCVAVTGKQVNWTTKNHLPNLYFWMIVFSQYLERGPMTAELATTQFPLVNFLSRVGKSLSPASFRINSCNIKIFFHIYLKFKKNERSDYPLTQTN